MVSTVLCHTTNVGSYLLNGHGTAKINLYFCPLSHSFHAPSHHWEDSRFSMRRQLSLSPFWPTAKGTGQLFTERMWFLLLIAGNAYFEYLLNCCH